MQNSYKSGDENKPRGPADVNEEKKLIALRKRAKELYFRDGLTKREISEELCVSRKFVIRWTQSPHQDVTIDGRGWKKGRRRKWFMGVEEKIREIHRYLRESPSEFYTGATAIEIEWRRRYPGEAPPPLRTIGKILSDLGLSEKRRRGRNKGAAKYLCYPEHTIYELLGGRVLECDFIGRKYISGRSEPLNFIGFSFKKAPRLRYFKRTEGETADNFISSCEEFFDKFEVPDFIKVDNSLAMIGSASGRRNVSRSMKYLLGKEVVPIFAVPRKPFSQASIEGNNSVFSRKFWNRIEFGSVAEVDEKLSWFNDASLRYTRYTPPDRRVRKEPFVPRVYFIRQVREEKKEEGRAFIDVLNEKVSLPESYVNYFVLAEWNLEKERLFIHFERDKNPVVVEEIPFKINRRLKNIAK
jgi:transposase